ncbi:MAG TPA: hypothetical protein VLM85_18285, partial [Polyangiaceae bacterium]|nr:hypothetical protein [Polyangiaceae bacterium]
MMHKWMTGASFAAIAMISSHALAQEAPVRALSFSEAVKEAIARNPSAQKALAEQRRLAAVVEETRSASLPTLSFNATYTLLDSDRTLPPGCIGGTAGCTVISPRNQVFGNLLVNVPVVAPPAWAAWSHASENVDVQKLNVADQNRLVALSAARGYLSVFSLKRLVEVSTIARDNAKAHYDFAKSRLAGGVGTTLDEARAEQELGTAEVQVQSAKILLDRARESLGVILGENTAVDVKEEPSLEGAGPIEQALRDAEATRTDVRLARGRVD